MDDYNIFSKMSILRSQEMDLYRIILPKDNDWEIMSELGQIGVVSSDSNHSSNSGGGAAPASNLSQRMFGGAGNESSRVSDAGAYQYAKDRMYTSGIIQFIDMNDQETLAHKNRLRYYNQLKRAQEAELGGVSIARYLELYDLQNCRLFKSSSIIYYLVLQQNCIKNFPLFENILIQFSISMQYLNQSLVNLKTIATNSVSK